MTPTGLPVNKIPHASQIHSWHAVDKRHLILSVSSKQNYLVTLRRDCHALNFATNVGVSTSNNTIYAGFDHITADGNQCAIQKINKISKDEKRQLVKA